MARFVLALLGLLLAALSRPIQGDKLMCVSAKKTSFWENLQPGGANSKKITEIRCNLRNWMGPIPTEIGLLTNLAVFEATDNYLEGTIPTEVGLLTNLHTFNVGYNFLSGGIPPQMAGLSKLAYVNILGRNDDMTGCVPQNMKCICERDHGGMATCEFEHLKYCSGKTDCDKLKPTTAAPTGESSDSDDPSTENPTTRSPTHLPTEFPTRAPTPFPTDRPTEEPTKFSCGLIMRKISCRAKKYAGICEWNGFECVDYNPTPFPTARPTADPTPFACSNFNKVKCKYAKFSGICEWDGISCTSHNPTVFPTSKPTREPTTFPTARPTLDPTPFACSNFNKAKCNYAKLRGICAWNGISCISHNPTVFPTAKPTSTPTVFACENAETKAACRSIKYRKRCEYSNEAQMCLVRTSKPTKAPTEFSCSIFAKKFLCNSKKNRVKCMWAEGACTARVPTGEPTRAPTKVPTDFSCGNAPNSRICRSFKYRKLCVFASGECIERTAKPTKAPTEFSCSILSKAKCKFKKFKSLCKYNTKTRKCESLETLAPTFAYVTEFENRAGCNQNVANQKMLATYTDGETLEDMFNLCNEAPDCVGVLKTASGGKLLGSESKCVPKSGSGSVTLYLRTSGAEEEKKELPVCDKLAKKNCLAIEGCGWTHPKKTYGKYCAVNGE